MDPLTADAGSKIKAYEARISSFPPKALPIFKLSWILAALQWQTGGKSLG